MVLFDNNSNFKCPLKFQAEKMSKAIAMLNGSAKDQPPSHLKFKKYSTEFVWEISDFFKTFKRNVGTAGFITSPHFRLQFGSLKTNFVFRINFEVSISPTFFRC